MPGYHAAPIQKRIGRRGDAHDADVVASIAAHSTAHESGNCDGFEGLRRSAQRRGHRVI